MHSVRRRYVDAVRRSGGAFSLSQQLRGAGKLRAALEADLSFAANRNAAARVSLPDQSDIPLFVDRTRGAVQSGSAGAKAGRTSRTLPASSQCGSSKALVAAVRSYTAVDYAEKLCTYCAENKVHLGILAAETNHPFCRILHCRVRRWEVKRFWKAAERLKEDSIKAADAGYVTACEERKGNLFKKTGRC